MIIQYYTISYKEKDLRIVVLHSGLTLETLSLSIQRQVVENTYIRHSVNTEF